MSIDHFFRLDTYVQCSALSGTRPIQRQLRNINCSPVIQIPPHRPTILCAHAQHIILPSVLFILQMRSDRAPSFYPSDRLRRRCELGDCCTAGRRTPGPTAPCGRSRPSCRRRWRPRSGAAPAGRRTAPARAAGALYCRIASSANGMERPVGVRAAERRDGGLGALSIRAGAGAGGRTVPASLPGVTRTGGREVEDVSAAI